MANATLTEIRQWPGKTVLDRDGNKIGKLDDVYFDDATGTPEWACVNTGLFGMRDTIIPVVNARSTGDDIRVPYEKDFVKDAPNVDADHDLDQQEEAELASYYGLEYSERRSNTGLPEGQRQSASPSSQSSGQQASPSRRRSTDDAMTRSEENLDVHATHRPSQLVRLRKYVVIENR